MTQTLRRLLLALTAAAVGLVGFSLVGDPPQLPQLSAPASASAAESRSRVKKDGYDLSQMEVFRRVVIYVKDNYVDPERINPREMFLSALEAVEKQTAEVMVEGDAAAGRVKVTAGTAVRDFDFSDVDTIWMIPHKIRPVFQFIQANLVSTTKVENRRDIEYAAINGMLSTLDPHSWLLKPDVYREMKLQTKGEFGGLGFVISMDDERLTVKKVLKNTPASRAGVKKGDHIARIEDESTINMELSEAVQRLRGKPGTEVRLWIRRGEEEKAQVLVRDTISIESVTSQLLDGKVGYVRLSSFAGTTSRDLQNAIKDLRKQAGGKLAGLVLDMRSNPGGLLEQAIQVADQFLSEGVIVTTAGMSGNLNEPKHAQRQGGELDYPIAVLVNSESASASEIVAGALKNHDRAVVVGRTTFGKGSVQVLYDLPEPARDGKKEESALKLTIAQYLTPGDKSIQETGVSPDIELLPARVSSERVDLFAPPRILREADLDRHFGNGFGPPQEAKKVVESAEQPSETFRYLREENPAKSEDATAQNGSDEFAEEEELIVDDPDEEDAQKDYQVRFARDLVLRAPKTNRTAMLEAARPYLAERRAEEEAKISKAMKALGVDWSVSKSRPKGAAAAVTEVTTSPKRAVPGEPFEVTLTVQNTGDVPLERLRGWTRCDAERTQFQQFCALLDRREFLFGKLTPGEKKSWTVPVKVRPHMPATHEVVSVVFEEAHGNAPEERVLEVSTTELARPAFAFNYQVLDGDGLAQPGETVDVRVDVKNTGKGTSTKSTYVSLRSQNLEKIFMKKGRFVLGEIAPGETKSAVLSLEVKEGIDNSAGVPLKLEIGDRDLWEFTTGKIALPSAATAPATSATTASATVQEPLRILAAPHESAPPAADAQKGAVLKVTSKVGDYHRVEWANDRFGFIPASAPVTLKQGKTKPPKGNDERIASTMARVPPTIELAGIDTSNGPIVVDGERFQVKGVAADRTGLLDVRVFVDNEKAFFRTAPEGRKPTTLEFSADFALKPGNNMVLVVAREDDEFTTQRTLVVHRRGMAVAQKKDDAAPATR